MFRVVPPDSDTADVMVAAVLKIETTETEPGVHGIQGGEPGGMLGNTDIALQLGLETRTDLPDRGPDCGLGLVAEHIEALVEQRDELLLMMHFLG
ncbi:hypothetical protein ABZY19_01230 [Streptomyces sp. NPDC006475]|uniref:Uncharacterized protein n=1 Tax=Streptomyces achmelvichensis TaxID=3134111 RepID=A0ACC6Q1G2_9ACTN